MKKFFKINHVSRTFFTDKKQKENKHIYLLKTPIGKLVENKFCIRLPFNAMRSTLKKQLQNIIVLRASRGVTSSLEISLQGEVDRMYADRTEFGTIHKQNPTPIFRLQRYRDNYFQLQNGILGVDFEKFNFFF